MRYSAETKLRPAQVFAVAREHFGPTGQAGLEITEQSANRLVFAGGGGYVIVSANQGAGRTRVELEVWEWDRDVPAFLADLPAPSTPLRRFFGRWSGRRRGQGERDR